jgi:hypothetical protein
MRQTSKSYVCDRDFHFTWPDQRHKSPCLDGAKNAAESLETAEKLKTDSALQSRPWLEKKSPRCERRGSLQKPGLRRLRYVQMHKDCLERARPPPPRSRVLSWGGGGD